jgi:two-component system, NarL family, response regulator NreC
VPKIRVLIADDHALVRAGLRALLSAQPDMEVIGEAADGVMAVEQCRRLSPHVVLLDLSMPGRRGIATIEDLRRTWPELRVLVVTMHNEIAYVRQALLAGAVGYVLKQSLATELLEAIRQVHQGRQFVTPSLLHSSLNPNELPVKSCGKNSLPGLLTPRELEVASKIALGHTNAEVAALLHISDKTVETHRVHIMTKLGIRTRADLVRFALEHQLME